MINIFKMDLRRIFYTKTFYVAIIFITIMAFALPISGMSNSLDTSLGVLSGMSATGDEFMTTTLGVGVITILVSIIVSIFVCGDYAHGVAKNIFSIHANKSDYIKGKVLSMSLLNGLLILLYLIESVIALLLFADGVFLAGGFIGVLTFVIAKWVVSCAISSAILWVCCFTRNMAWGIIGGFLLSTGGITMGISLLAEAFHLNFITTLMTFTISGASQLATLMFEPLMFIKIISTAVVWIVICCLLSKKTLMKKDV